MAALGLGVSAIFLGALIWVYFDAEERGKNGIAWALATIFTWGLALLVYLAVRNHGRRQEVAPGVGMRLYLYVAAFSGAYLVALGLSMASVTLLRASVSDAGLQSGSRDAVASGLVAAMIGSVVVWIHAGIARRRLTEFSGPEFRAEYAIRRLALRTFAAVNLLAAVLSALLFLGGAASSALGASYSAATRWLPGLGSFIVTGCAAWLSWQAASHMERSALAEPFRAVPEPDWIEAPPPPPVAPAPMASVPVPPPMVASPVPGAYLAPPPSAFCGHCGTQSADMTDRFCRRCGAELAPTPVSGLQPHG
jgi:hypothetical protein